MSLRSYLAAVVALACFSAIAPSASAQYGVALTGVGPVNRSMAGTATAAPIDAMGALYWNPATISALPSSSMEFGLELLYPQCSLGSSIGPSAFGPGIPGATLTGSDNSESGVFALPAFGLVLQPEDSCLTYGLGVFAVGGFGANLPGNPANPILSPPPPGGFGVGPIYSQYQVLQVVPTVSMQVTDRLSVGIAPTVDLAMLSLDPAFFATPGPNFPSATHPRYHWGLGFQIGMYYETESCWNFGASLKTPQWFESLHYHSATPAGAPRVLKFGLDYPMMISLGTSYTGFDRLTLAADMRWINYSDTNGYSQTGYDTLGNVRGLGWDDVYATSFGAQYLWTDRTTLRGGYSFSTNPIDADKTFFNIASPLLIQHAIYMGLSYDVTASLQLSLAYSHMFENSSTGPYVLPGIGALPGTSVTSTTSGDSVIAGAAVRF